MATREGPHCNLGGAGSLSLAFPPEDPVHPAKENQRADAKVLAEGTACAGARKSTRHRAGDSRRRGLGFDMGLMVCRGWV